VIAWILENWSGGSGEGHRRFRSVLFLRPALSRWMRVHTFVPCVKKQTRRDYFRRRRLGVFNFSFLNALQLIAGEGYVRHNVTWLKCVCSSVVTPIDLVAPYHNRGTSPGASCLYANRSDIITGKSTSIHDEAVTAVRSIMPSCGVWRREAEDSSKTLVNVYQSTRRHNTEDSILKIVHQLEHGVSRSTDMDPVCL
jgi:hypothetical protein